MDKSKYNEKLKEHYRNENYKSIIAYNKQHEKRLQLSFYDKDHELYDWVKSKPNVTGFIKELLYKAKQQEENQ